MKCPKCGYARRMGETAPEWQCPACGVAYAKAQATARTRRKTAGSGGYLVKIVLSLALVGVGYAFLGPSQQRTVSSQTIAGQPQDHSKARVIMYSLTTCGYCTAKRYELKANGIPFVEHFMDTDPERFTELTSKLQAAGMRGGAIGTPSFDVNGTILLNNPTIETIRKHL